MTTGVVVVVVVVVLVEMEVHVLKKRLSERQVRPTSQFVMPV